MARTDDEPLLLGEWACLGVLYSTPTHGFAVASRFKPTGDLGRIWSLSRPLTYRALEQLSERGLITAIGEEPGKAGGVRTILSATRSGRSLLRRWVASPVTHVRDLRSELLVKLAIADDAGLDPQAMLGRQRDHLAHLATTFDADAARDAHEPVDAVALWRRHATHAALAFLDELIERRHG